MAKEQIEFPHILKKTEGRRMRVENQEEYDRAVADGWSLTVPAEPPPTKTTKKTTEETTEVDLAQQPAKALEVAPPAKDENEHAAKSVKAAKTGESHDLVLDGTVADVSDHVAKVSDLRQLQNLRLQEVKNANRAGALKAIDDRIAELKG